MKDQTQSHKLHNHLEEEKSQRKTFTDCGTEPYHSLRSNNEATQGNQLSWTF